MISQCPLSTHCGHSGRCYERAMSYILLLAFVVALIAAIWKGCIGIYGGAVYRSENPVLFWAQVIVLGAVAILLGTAITLGDL